jgi:hypothetical protein
VLWSLQRGGQSIAALADDLGVNGIEITIVESDPPRTRRDRFLNWQLAEDWAGRESARLRKDGWQEQ